MLHNRYYFQESSFLLPACRTQSAFAASPRAEKAAAACNDCRGLFFFPVSYGLLPVNIFAIGESAGRISVLSFPVMLCFAASRLLTKL